MTAPYFDEGSNSPGSAAPSASARYFPLLEPHPAPPGRADILRPRYVVSRRKTPTRTQG